MPPLQTNQGGGRKTKRIRKGRHVRQKQKCGSCNQMINHNSRSCQAQPNVKGLSESTHASLVIEAVQCQRPDEQRSREKDELDQKLEGIEAATNTRPIHCLGIDRHRSEDFYQSKSSDLLLPLYDELPPAPVWPSHLL